MRLTYIQTEYILFHVYSLKKNTQLNNITSLDRVRDTLPYNILYIQINITYMGGLVKSFIEN